jgi:hypothetical protein
MRAIFETGAPASTIRPCCSKCGKPTLLVGIESTGHDLELLTFQCVSCEGFQTAVGKTAKH